MRSLTSLLSLVVLLLPAVSAQAEEGNSKVSAFRKSVEPLLTKYCARCHGPKKARGDLDLTKLNWDLINGPDAETWHDVLNRLNRGEMPPETADQPGQREHRLMVRQITGEIQRLVEARRDSGGKVVLRRLTRYEYDNTLRDLLGISSEFARDLPPDPASLDGFRNNGAALGISPLQIEYYLKAARSALNKAIVTGPEPKVHKARAEKSSRNRRKKQDVGNKLGPSDVFLMVAKQFPRTGEVLVRVLAGSHVPEGTGYPRMRISLGVRADTLAPMKTLGEMDVTASQDSPGVYEIRGRIENFPLPGANPKFPGLLITVENVYADGTVPQNKGKKKRKKNATLDPTKPWFEVKSVEFEGPVFEQWPPKHHVNLMFASPNSGNEKVYVREVLTRFMTRAFRRPATKAEVNLHVRLFEKVRPRVDTFEAAMREVLAMVLISPEFLYLVEPHRGEAKSAQPLTDHELAARMSYFLWSTMPDEELSRLATAKKLNDPVTLAKQVDRMITDGKSWELVRHFTNQWLDLDAVERVAVNPEFYPQFDDRLKPEMRRETEHFFAEILHWDLSALNLIDSDFVMVNRALAKHYGITGPKGSAFERVAIKPDDKRGGLLTQGSVLLGNSTGEHSHPIRRAVWLLDRLLDDPPAPPPPDVPDLNQNEPDIAKLSIRKQLEIHRTKSACMNCHRNIDPWGVAFENYDAVGLWRDVVQQSGGKRGRKPATTTVESTTSLPDGAKIEGMAGLKQHLLKHRKNDVARAIVVKMLTYALGRSISLSDQTVVEDLTKKFVASDYRLRTLIIAIVQSKPFRSK